MDLATCNAFAMISVYSILNRTQSNETLCPYFHHIHRQSIPCLLNISICHLVKPANAIPLSPNILSILSKSLVSNSFRNYSRRFLKHDSPRKKQSEVQTLNKYIQNRFWASKIPNIWYKQNGSKVKSRYEVQGV